MGCSKLRGDFLFFCNNVMKTWSEIHHGVCGVCLPSSKIESANVKVSFSFSPSLSRSLSPHLSVSAVSLRSVCWRYSTLPVISGFVDLLRKQHILKCALSQVSVPAFLSCALFILPTVMQMHLPSACDFYQMAALKL